MNYSKKEGRYQTEWERLWERWIRGRTNDDIYPGEDFVQSRLIYANSDIHREEYFDFVWCCLITQVSPQSEAEVTEDDDLAESKDLRIKEGIFDDAKLEQIKTDLQRIELFNLLRQNQWYQRDNWPVEHLWDEILAIVIPEQDKDENCFDRITNCVVEWCQHHPHLLPLNSEEVSASSIADIFSPPSPASL